MRTWCGNSVSKLNLCTGLSLNSTTYWVSGWHHYTGTHGEPELESRSMRQKNVASPRRAEPSVCVLLMRARGRCHKGAAQYQVHSVRRACQSQRGVATRPAAAYVGGSAEGCAFRWPHA